MSYETLLAERREASRHEARNIINRATVEKRDLTATEKRDFDRIIADLESQDAAGDRLAERNAENQTAETALRRLADTPVERRVGHMTAENREIGDKFRSAILEKNPAPIVLRDPAARSYYQPGVEARAIGLGSSPSTGVTFYNRMITALVETSSVLKAGATLVSTDTGEPLRIPRQTAFGSAALVAEGAAIPEGDPSQSNITLGAFKYGKLITVSNELAEDAAFDLAGYLANEAGTAIGLALGADLINGSGSGAPRGVLLDATVGVTGPTGTATSLGAQGTAGQGTDLLNNLWASLAEPYTESAAAAFLLRSLTLNTVRNLKSTQGELVGNQYLANPPAPFYVDPFVPAMAANAKSVIFGDWSRYFVRFVNGIRFEQSRDFAWNTDQTVFRAVLRADGALADTTGAIKWFANSAT